MQVVGLNRCNYRLVLSLYISSRIIAAVKPSTILCFQCTSFQFVAPILSMSIFILPTLLGLFLFCIPIDPLPLLFLCFSGMIVTFSILSFFTKFVIRNRKQDHIFSSRPSFQNVIKLCSIFIVDITVVLDLIIIFLFIQISCLYYTKVKWFNQLISSQYCTTTQRLISSVPHHMIW